MSLEDRDQTLYPGMSMEREVIGFCGNGGDNGKGTNNQALRRGFAPAAAGRTADPAIHSGEVEACPAVHYGKPESFFLG
ncbi:hypothetical protein FCV25MIE_12263 [Fagus crenata]